jgi:hypothetical protein
MIAMVILEMNTGRLKPKAAACHQDDLWLIEPEIPTGFYGQISRIIMPKHYAQS